MQIQEVVCVFSVWIYAASQEAISAINDNISQVSDVFHFDLRLQNDIDNAKLL